MPVHASVCDMIADLVQNSIEAGASHVELDVHTDTETIRVRVADNGKGMDKTTLKKIVDPFYSEAGKHDHRRVGLGIPLLLQTVEAVAGNIDIRSELGKETVVEFTLDARHIDTPPLGDLPATVLGLMAFAGTYDLTLKRSSQADGYSVSRNELAEALGNIEDSGNLILARNFLRSQEDNLNH